MLFLTHSVPHLLKLIPALVCDYVFMAFHVYTKRDRGGPGHTYKYNLLPMEITFFFSIVFLTQLEFKAS